jgi:hypothetical protein
MVEPWIFDALVFIVIGGFILTTAFVPVTGSQVDDFAQAYHLTPSPTSRRMIRHQLTLGKRIRNLLIVDALVLPPLFVVAFFGSIGEAFNLLAIIPVTLGCAVVGAAITELVASRPSASSSRRVAVLVPREPASYLSKVMRWWPPIGAAATVVALAATQLVHVDPATDDRPSVAWMAIASVVVIIVPSATVVISRWIVRRPQPFLSADLISTDNALREATIRRISGLAGATVGVFLAAAFFALANAVGAPNGTVFGLGGIASAIAAITSFGARQLVPPPERKRRTGSP